jgi:hypothetical protein
VRTRSVILILSALMAVSVSGVALAARPAPPGQLIGIFEDFEKLEVQLEHEAWDKALAECSTIVDRVKILLPELRKTVGPKLLDDFSFILDKLKGSLVAKNEDNSLKFYIALQKLFMEVTSLFDYPVPPVLQVTRKYIDEAGSALPENDFEEVLREMDEIHAFLRIAEPILLERGVPPADLQVYASQVADVRSAAKVKDATRSAAALKNLTEQADRFLALFAGK